MIKKISKILSILLLLGTLFLSVSSCKQEIPTPTTAVITYKTSVGLNPPPVTVPLNKKLDSVDLKALESIEQNFEGWYIGSQKIEVGYVIKHDITLTAIWSKKKCTIYYDNNGYGEIQKNKIVEKGHKITKVDLPVLVDNSSEFNGWFIGNAQIKEGTIVNDDITLIAHWTDKPCIITYDNNTHGKPINPKSLKKGSQLFKEQLPQLTDDYFIFEGWYIAEEKINEGYELNNNITLTAKWKPITCTITYKIEGSTIKTQTVNKGYKLTAEDLKLPEGVEKNKWYLNGEIAKEGTSITEDSILTIKKDIFEQDLNSAKMQGYSMFGKNIIQITNLSSNYNNFVLYRFGPGDDPNLGKLIDISKASHPTNDSLYIEDICRKSNPMSAGQYTYKLFSKSTINSSRTIINSEKSDDYWANPNQDIVYLPSVISVVILVSEANMPKQNSRVRTLKKEDIRIAIQELENKIIIISYSENNSILKLEATASNLDSFETTTNNTILPIKESSNKFVFNFPAKTAKYNLYAYYEWYDDYYQKSDRVLLETITVKP